MGVPVVGRELEWAAVGSLLDRAVERGPSGLVLWGEAGIGKSTIWQAAVDEARRRAFTLMSCRPAEPELRLSYSGLADLLVEIDEAVMEGLPHPQRRALDTALLRGG